MAIYYADRVSQISPEVRLMIGVFEQAIEEQDLDWVLCEGNEPFSFNHLCEAIGIDSKSTRVKLLEQFTRKPKRQRKMKK